MQRSRVVPSRRPWRTQRLVHQDPWDHFQQRFRRDCTTTNNNRPRPRRCPSQAAPRYWAATSMNGGGGEGADMPLPLLLCRAAGL